MVIRLRTMSFLNYTLQFSEDFENDYENIVVYTMRKWGIDQVDKYKMLIAEKMDILAFNPDLGHRREDLPSHYRAMQAGKHIIIYKIENQSIFILRIVHERICMDEIS